MSEKTSEQTSVKPSEKTAFHIGIAMSGAASAGAYTAGVFDFLIEALSEWQKAKDDKVADVPKHDVFISTLAGTSAGGITASLGLMSLAGGVRSVEEKSANPKGSPIKRTLPELYDVWVKNLRLFGAHDPLNGAALTGNLAMLDTGDLKPGSLPNSLVNSDTLTSVARRCLSSVAPDPKAKPLPFFTNPTHLYLTRANLDGVVSSVGFGNDEFLLKLYEGRAHYAISGLGDRPFPDSSCTWLKDCADPGIALDINKLRHGQIKEQPWPQPLEEPFEGLVQATLATSAIPVVFAAREIKNPFAQDTELDTILAGVASGLGQMGITNPDGEGFEVPDGPRVQLEAPNSICTDGGSFNNDPFEIVRWTIRDLSEKRNPRNAEHADRAVILIAPFPGVDLPDQSKENQRDPKKHQGPDISLRSIIRKLGKAYLHHAKFKALDLAAASNNNVYSRFLVGPKHLHPDREKERADYQDDKTKGKAKREFPVLATDALGHAAGFFDEQFSEHDFQLGRHNCQRFLQSGFKLHKKNKLFRDEMQDTNDEYYQLKAPEVHRASARTPSSTDDYRPIIPLVGSMRDPIELPPWPQMSRSKLPQLQTAIQHRFDHLAATVIADTSTSWLMRTGAQLAWRAGRKEIVQKGVGHIINQLEKTGQIGPAPDRRGFWQPRPALVTIFLLAAVLGVLIAVAFLLDPVVP